VRGPFKFNSNGFPVQDFYLVKVASAPTASSRPRSCRRSSRLRDGYASQCELK